MRRSVHRGPGLAPAWPWRGSMPRSIAQTAAWLSIHPSEVRIALAYHAAFTDEIEEQRRLRLEVAAEERARYDAEQALLG